MSQDVFNRTTKTRKTVTAFTTLPISPDRLKREQALRPHPFGAYSE